MSLSLEVRPARAVDLDAVVETEVLAFSTPWSRRTFEALLGRGEVLFRVLEWSGHGIVGHGVLWWMGPEAEIANLAVHPAARGTGAGSRLLDALVAEAALRGVERVFLEVRESNAAARALYDRRGFVPVGRRPRYYQKPVEDALVLALDLDAPALPSDPEPHA
jgi:[ribosomal protein S18]-alanine N-acetyltransferase